MKYAFVLVIIFYVINFASPLENNLLLTPIVHSHKNLIVSKGTLTPTLLDQISKAENKIVFYYMPWCKHCKKALPLFSQASEYQMAQNFTFFILNCKENAPLCDKEKIESFPTVRITYASKKINFDIGTDTINILSAIQKIQTFSFKKLYSREDINKFSEIAFVIETPKNISDTLIKNCLDEYENKADYIFLHNFYFFINQTAKEERLWINGRNYTVSNCMHLLQFLEDRKFETLRELDSNYFNIVKYHKKTLIIFFLSVKLFHQEKSNIISLSERNKEYVFTYIITNQDNDSGMKFFIDRFKPKEKTHPNILVYNFTDSTYTYLSGDGKFDGRVIEKLKGEKFYSGDPVQDFFYWAGLGKFMTINRLKKILLFLIVSLSIFFFWLVICYDDSNDAERKEKEE